MQPDTIRSIVTEALASQKSSALEAPIDIPQPQFDISEMYQVIGSLKASIAQTTSNHLQADDVRELVDDAFKRQSMEVAKREESEAILKRDARIAELESMVEDSTLRHEAEEAARKALEDREADTARLLKVTEEELALLQAAAKDDESRIRALTEERDVMRRSLNAYQTDGNNIRDKLAVIEAENEELKMKNVALETSEEDLKTKFDAVTAENEALTFTLEEHRKSANKWRSDIQEAHQENGKLREAINQARYQAEEAARVRESMRGKFEKLQQDMVLASQQIAAERSQWQKNEQASLEKYEVLSARIEAEGRTRERLERELERLETQEGEGMKLRIHFEQSQKHNAKLEETIEQLRRESIEHQNNAHKYERDMREAREAAHVEIRRTRVLMEADLDAANNQVNVVRHNLESEISRVRAELDSVRMEAETAREKHELELEAASDATKQAVEEALQRSKRTQHEQQQAFERGFERLKQEHTRALEFAREDKQRADAFYNDKLALADSKLDHYKDKIALLEEKLVVAKEAASAAAAAAAKSPASSGLSTLGSHEKISPQALRESISVLQEQLQERESRIESLEQKLSEVDTEAPVKLKERDTEITWLRELLGVRVDDINDLINALAQPTFDRETVRDAAIRIRTNLQMEQSEKERLISGGQSTFPTLATLSNFASPKAVQVAAAFGNWRKGRQNAASALAGPSGSSSRNQTPSRPATHSAQSFLSGLMTPPTSNMRRTPDFPSSSKPKDLRSNSTSSRGSTATEQGFPALGKQSAAPSTPPLLRKTSYDRDAAVEDFSDAGYDDDSTVDGGDVTPIALNFGQELRSRRDRD
jgi:chromosome segregation ATPase